MVCISYLILIKKHGISMNTALFIKFLFGLFAIINPFACLPVYLSLTEGYTKKAKLKTATMTFVGICVIAILFAVAGKSILNFFGITLDAFKVAGGVIIFYIALGMLNKKATSASSESSGSAETASNPAIIPLTMPMTMGPGSIVKIVAFAAMATTIQDDVSILVAVIVNAGLVFLIFLAGTFLAKLFGKTGMDVISKIMAIVLAAIAFEMILAGTKSFFLA